MGIFNFDRKLQSSGGGFENLSASGSEVPIYGQDFSKIV